MNGHLSPDTNLDLSHSMAEMTDGGGEVELPPPIPVKKRHMYVPAECCGSGEQKGEAQRSAQEMYGLCVH